MTKCQLRLLAALVVCSAAGSPVRAQYTQNFNTLASTGTSSTVPLGWGYNETGPNADGLYAAGTGSGTAGNVYSFGTAAADRAFGALRSGNVIPTLGARFQNNTGSTLSNLDITYTGEQWRFGATGRADQLDFQYSLNATSITDAGATWFDVNALDFISPNTTATVGPLDGNAAVNRTQLTSTITGLTLANGDFIWFRWLDVDAAGADDGLAIDDFGITQSLTPVTVPVPEPASVLAIAAGAVGVGGYARRRLARQSSAAE